MNIQQLLKQLPLLAKEKKAENKKFFDKLKKKPPKNLDYTTEDIHNQIFEEIDCVSCANCCKTTGPLYTTADIDRIAKYLKMKPQQFINQYLKIDEDNDYVLQELPCSFLDNHNLCIIYDVRPKACREYPHINRKKIHQIANITIKNTEICPAAYKAVEKMKQIIK